MDFSTEIKGKCYGAYLFYLRRKDLKITFGQQTILETEKKNTERKIRQEQESMAAGQTAFATFAQGRTDILPGQGVEKGKSLIEIQQDAVHTDVDAMQDYMTLAANTMSEEDYAKMQEEGFDFGSMNPEESVTIVDKIKAELVRAGEHIAGYTDDLGVATLTEALGSETLARAVADSFAAADIPVTESNVTDVSQAWNMAEQLQPVSDGSCEYMIDNELEPEIWNLYLAQSSGAGKGNGAPKFYQENVQGYFARTATGEAQGELAEQIDRVIEQSGREVNQENREKANWLLEKGLPLTGENLQRLEQLREIGLPVTEKQFADAVARAVADGKKPIHASLMPGKTIYERAAATYDYYQGEEIWNASAGNITARRQLEEIRLRMTAEVNVKLLKSGVSIDTAPMEQLVEALKDAEHALAEQYFPGEEEAVTKFQMYRRTNEVVAQVPALPVDVLGLYAENSAYVTLEEIHSAGVQLRDTYEKAQSSYEALMTAPRADLGDSIRKAFANVDDILQDLGYELTDENRRSVRILGYNNMEIVPEKIELIRAADAQVKSVIAKMTPASVLKMIRDGINPLEQSMAELEQYFEDMPEEYKQQAESYSRFLLGLEKNGDITPEERDGYIGIYRLVRQLEKADGAAVGALVNAQAEIHFSNLLTAVRSSKAKHMDAKVGEQLGTLSELVRKGESISEQIAKAFVNTANDLMTSVSYSEESEQSYLKQQYEAACRVVAAADAECVAMLQRGELPVNADNLLAVQTLLQGDRQLFGTVMKGAGSNLTARAGKGAGWRGVADSEEHLDSQSPKVSGEESLSEEWAERLVESLDEKEDFAANYGGLLSEMKEAVENATFDAADTVLDVREMQLAHKQLTVASALAPAEEYFVPMYIGGELAGVHLTFDRTGEEKGTVNISVELADGEKIRAKFYLENSTLRGIFTGETENEVMKLEKIADTFRKEAENSWEVESIQVMQAGRGAAEGFATEERNRTQSSELYAVAKAFLKSVQQGEETYEN